MRLKLPAACAGLLLVALFANLAVAETLEMVSDSMVYDPGSGTIRAEGNVRVTGESIDASARRGEAASDGRVMRLFGEVDASWEKGLRTILCEEMEVEITSQGRRIRAEKVNRFEDSESGVVLRADKVKALVRGGIFITMEAEGGVKADTTAADGLPTTLTSHRADYDRSRGVLVFYGEARAVQPGRTLTADRLVYRPETGSIEAEGSPRIIMEMELES